MGRTRGPEQQGVRSLRRPAGHIRSAKIGRVELAPVTLATPSMRPAPVAAGFQPCGPGSVSRAAKAGSSASARAGKSESNAASGAGPEELRVAK